MKAFTTLQSIQYRYTDKTALCMMHQTSAEHIAERFHAQVVHVAQIGCVRLLPSQRF